MQTVKSVLLSGIALCICGAASLAQAQTTVTIATVNNGDMIRMQELSGNFIKNNPDIQLNWITLDENVLRQRVTTDIATKGGQFDVLTIGNYEAPIWAKREWLVPLDDLPEGYDVDDILPPIREGLVVRRHAVRRAVLRRVLIHHVPHRPVRESRARDARKAHMGISSRTLPASWPTRATRSMAFACVASRAGGRTWRS